MRLVKGILASCIFAGFSFAASESAVAEVEISAAVPHFLGGNGDLFKKNGDAKIDGTGLQLTRSSGTLYGTAFYKDLITLSPHRSFSAYFTFRITDPNCAQGGGADGLTFIVQTDSDSVGSMGGGIGYAGILPSVAVEFDTFKNTEFGDEDGNHIGISVDGDPESKAKVAAPFPLSNGALYHAWVDYDGKQNTMQVRLSATDARPSTPTLSYKVDLESIMGQEVFVGFTAATGSCWERHEISSFYFHNDELIGGIDPSLDSFVSSAQ